MCVRNPDCGSQLRWLAFRNSWIVSPAGRPQHLRADVFITKEGEEGGNQQHQFPKNELRSPPMIEHGHRRQRADEKETDLAHAEQDMT